jgi:hypothetical protein
MKNPKKSLFILSVLLVGTVLALVFTACANDNKDDIDKEYTVKYEITGPATVASFVLYRNSTGGLVQIDDVNIPWSYTITVSGKGKQYISVSCGVGLPYSNKDTYTTNLYINGKLEQSSSGTNTVTVSHVIY